jgi:16S rRNA (cytosine967-C5)-methyltransferase
MEILTEVFTQHRPASDVLRDWGKSHRFAGSTDRHAIGTLVYDTLRRRNSASARMGDGRPRALVLGTLRDVWSMTAEDIETLCTEQHGPGVLTAVEKTALARALRDDLPDYIAGDYPEWLQPAFHRVFGAAAVREGAALSARAPIDLRVNTLKTQVPALISAFAKYGAVAGPLSPLCVRIKSSDAAVRNINVEVEPEHGKGWFEVQDAASQVAALMSGVRAPEQVLDLCAGAGGKTLALAALVGNKGKIVAYDADRHRLRPIFERMTRAGVDNVEVVGADGEARLVEMGGFDCVFVDAPCSGSGAWRRKPDAKWRLSERQLQQRLKDQREVLDKAARLVKPGGRLVYVTCSVLAEENTDQVAAFLERHHGFTLVPYGAQWRKAIGGEPPVSADGSAETLLLTPAQHGTDGFFIAVLRKA